MVDLGFPNFYFHGHFRDVITEIVNLEEIVANSFPTLSAFAASDLSLVFGQFFLFYPENIFFFFFHELVEQGFLLGHMASFPSRMHVSILFRIIRLIVGIQ
ncbi:hypothetical protein N665_0310s0003, partial [Sinapis alba]